MVCLCQQAACTCLRLSRASASPVQHSSEGSTASPALAVALKDWCFKCTGPCRPCSSRAWLVPGCGGSDVALPKHWQVPLNRSVGQVGMCSGLGSFTSGLRGHFTEDGLLLTLPSSGRLTRRSMPKHSSCSQTTMFAKAERQCVTSPARVAGRHGNVAVAVLAIVIEQVHEQLLARLPFQAPGPSRVSRPSRKLSCIGW